MDSEREMRRHKVQEMQGGREYRVVQAIPELRTASDGTLALRGHASRFSNWYDIGDPERNGFRERIMPGSFRQALSETPDVSLMLGHGDAGSGFPLARTTAGNLALSEDALGLAVDASPLDPDDPDVKLLAAKMRSKLVSGMSFAFLCTSDSWSDDRSERTITGVSLEKGDVSVCVHGANELASAEMVARSLEMASAVRRPAPNYGRRHRERLAQMRGSSLVVGDLVTLPEEIDTARFRRRLDELRGDAA
jgi:HK97 family phage prohead protease